MISDTLSDALVEINQYLNDPAFDDTYQGDVLVGIQDLVLEMDAVRAYLDCPVPAFPIKEFIAEYKRQRTAPQGR